VLADLHTVYAQARVKLYPELDRAAIATPTWRMPPVGDDAISRPDVPDPPRRSPSAEGSQKRSGNIWGSRISGKRSPKSSPRHRAPAVAAEDALEILFITTGHPRSD
jgi:hypothetical protein